MDKSDIGLVGLGVMGQNLALNIESKGFSVVGYDYLPEKVDEFIKGKAAGKKIIGKHSVPEMVEALTKPRKIMMMVTAGKAVDDVIEKLVPALDKGDIIIDGGNSHFKDTIRRTKDLEAKGLLFIGTGVSGGEEGALKGPSIMPGGSPAAWPYVQPILQKIAAKVADGTPCCQWVGSDGAGHFVKMVHNGIEYADMQLISEAYFLLKEALGLEADELHRIFAEWNKGELNSYLIEITTDIFTKKDAETGLPIVDVILDSAGQKGTGSWTSQTALELGVAAPTIAEAVFARCISAIKSERITASKKYSGTRIDRFENREFAKERGINIPDFIETVRQALYASKICSYAQGFALMREASKEYSWNLNFGEIALLWRAGCIIRASFLDRIKEAFDAEPNLPNLLVAPYFMEVIDNAQNYLRFIISMAASTFGIPIPAFSSALAYFDSYRRERLPANLIQAQRDYFGAHTYKRIDKEGTFHTDWMSGRK